MPKTSSQSDRIGLSHFYVIAASRPLNMSNMTRLTLASLPVNHRSLLR